VNPIPSVFIIINLGYGLHANPAAGGRDAGRGAAASRKDATPPAASRKGIRGWIFALVSLGIVAMFALIVNIVLPGPAGKKPDSGLPQWEESSDQKAPASPQTR